SRYGCFFGKVLKGKKSGISIYGCFYSGRSLLPAPEAGTLEVPKYNYCVAEIHDTLNTLTKYMKRSKLAVRDS
ncbi:hypothetical protein, partial [Vibrio alfacsensis]|uniref:hypothetical protein n=1 Tax=Vibrio alfacsensis TaxID=1074311 RepID=UPI0040697550